MSDDSLQIFADEAEDLLGVAEQALLNLDDLTDVDDTVGEQTRQRRGNRDTRRWTVLGRGALGDVDVNVHRFEIYIEIQFILNRANV